MAKSIKSITNEIMEFSEEMGWEYKDPNHLITSIIIELGELGEHFQWKDKFDKYDDDKKREVGFEFVDVMVYFFELARVADIDLEHWFEVKYPLLKEKFRSSKDHTKIKEEYRKSGKNKLYK